MQTQPAPAWFEPDPRPLYPAENAVPAHQPTRDQAHQTASTAEDHGPSPSRPNLSPPAPRPQQPTTRSIGPNHQPLTCPLPTRPPAPHGERGSLHSRSRGRSTGSRQLGAHPGFRPVCFPGRARGDKSLSEVTHRLFFSLSPFSHRCGYKSRGLLSSRVRRWAGGHAGAGEDQEVSEQSRGGADVYISQRTPRKM